MEGAIFLLFVILTSVAIVSAMVKADEQNQHRERVKRFEAFMDDVANKSFDFVVNIKGDLNGVIALGDIVIKNSFNKIEEHNKVLAAAVGEVGNVIKAEEKLTSEKKNEVYEAFKRLVASLTTENKQLVNNNWQNFLTKYPEINKDLTAYLILEKTVKTISCGLKPENLYIDEHSSFSCNNDFGGDSGSWGH
ncbi:hypothetical protein EAG18_07505 [Pseudoalteromonas sp. J010]|uniref:hypothetical protein n=1 Tax=Pseudoalteromonas sp. J010 TaxID=998465 RepID=UPI000F655184|nr:hypothetical protein [Pseudoalteromonas sp. J010]RRS09280.1 hypothetical protein EAG18_07505 [Pseudoalteromonas sp. J010]